MGNCAVKLTPEEKKALELDKKIASQNQKDHVKDSTIIKILLLGTGESGKSTIFKQVRELYSNNKFDKKELKSWAPMIYENINKQIKAILYANDKLGVELSNPYLTKYFDKDNYSDNTVITKDVANKLTELWNDAGFQRRWNCRAEYQVLECIEYYMRPENISRISQNPQSYIPTFDDIVHARVRTTGIITEKFRISSADFEMYDVGGQRSERKKWLNCFDNVTTVIFVAAINEYDQKLFEEAGEDRIREALRVWKDIVNRDEFKAVGFVLFLNKFDLFQEKLTKFPFRTDKRNQDYRGPDPMTQNKKTDQENAIYECAEYMKQKFLNQVDRRGVGAVNAYFTNATDSNNMRWVFETCEEQILRMNLSNSGFGNIQMFTQ